MQDWTSASDKEEATALQATRRLAAACQPLYRHLFVPISQQPGGPENPPHVDILLPGALSPGFDARHVFDKQSVSPAGILFLMNLRADLRSLLHEQPAGAVALRALDTALRCVQPLL